MSSLKHFFNLHVPIATRIEDRFKEEEEEAYIYTNSTLVKTYKPKKDYGNGIATTTSLL